MKNKTRLATLAALAGNSIFGFSFMFSRIALNTAEPFILLAYRFSAAFLLMLPLAPLLGHTCGGHSQNGSPSALRFDLRNRSILPPVVLGLIQPVGYFLFESYGIALTNATVSGVIISLYPIFGIALGALALKERPSHRQVLFSVLSVAAVGFLTLLQSDSGTVRPLGIVLLIGAVLTATAFGVMTRGLSARYSALERTVVMMGVAAVVFDLLAVIRYRSRLSLLAAPLSSPSFLLSVGYLSVLSSVAAFLALNYAGSHLSVARTTAFSNLTTVISLFAGAVFLGERFGVDSLVASVIIVLCVSQVQRG